MALSALILTMVPSGSAPFGASTLKLQKIHAYGKIKAAMSFRSCHTPHIVVDKVRKMAEKGARQYTNPAVYDAHHKEFQSKGVPSGQAEWVERARAVAVILSQDAPQRDIENKAPAAEISLLKSSGLLKVLGPKAYGGGGEAWDTGYKVIREVAKGDGSIGMLLGYHLLWSTTANVVGTEDQAQSVQKVLTEQNLVSATARKPNVTL
jgi:alkylation response protein AidB-like acyl-CoA dehydrogenase